MGDVDGSSLKEEQETCKHFLLDSEMEIETQESSALLRIL